MEGGRTMKRISCLVCCGLVAAFVQGRTVSLGPVDGADLKVQFGTAAAGETNALVMAWGDVDAGEDPAAWTNRRVLGLVKPEEAERNVSLPADWGRTGATRLRVFLQNGVEAPSDYVSGGLLSRWDAIDNAGTGVHDASTRVWKDLAGSLDFTLTNSAAWKEGSALSVDGFSAVAASATPAYATIEIVGRGTTQASNGRVVFSSGFGASADTQLSRLFVDMVGMAQFKAGSTTFIPIPQDGSFFWKAATYTGDNPTLFYSEGAPARDTLVLSEGWRRAELGRAAIGKRTAGDNYPWKGELHTIRIYSRVLAPSELEANFRLDAVRFCGFPNTITATTASSALAFSSSMSLRSITVDAQGVQKAAVLAFSGVLEVSELWMVWGGTDCGADPSNWPNVGRVGFVSPGEYVKTVPLPSGWGGSTARAVRFFIVPGVTVPAGYVSSGLVTRWDGLDNAGTGSHDATATVWKDLAGSIDLTLTNSAAWNASGNGLVVSGLSAYGKTKTSEYRTIEVCISPAMMSQHSVCFYSGAGGSHARSVFVDTVGVVYFEGCRVTTAAPVAFDNQPHVFSATYNGSSVVDSVRGDGDLTVVSHNNGWNWGSDRNVKIGARNYNTTEYPWQGTMHAIRLYNRVLTQEELLANAALDFARFKGVPAAGAMQAITEAGLYAAATGQGDVNPVAEPVAESAEISVDLRTGVRTVVKQKEILPLTWSSTNFTGAAFAGQYVTDGLVARWDAIDNAGTGAHNPSSTVWKDLAGSLDMTLTSNGSWTNRNALVVNGASASGAAGTPYYETIEVVYKQTKLQDHTILFASGNTSGASGNLNTRWFLIDSTSTGASSLKGYFDGTKTTRYFPMTYDATALRTAAGVYNSNNAVTHVYGDGIESSSTMNNTWNNWYNKVVVGQRNPSSSDQYNAHGLVHAIRLYNRPLTEAELARNRAIDLIRFSGDPLLSVDLEACTARVRVIALEGTGDDLAAWAELPATSRTLVQRQGESTVTWFAKPGVWKVVLEIVYDGQVVLAQPSVFDLRGFHPAGTTIVLR